MYEQLYSYLIRNKELALPGIGTFRLTREAATADFVSKSFFAPKYSFAFDREEDTPAKYLFAWLSATLKISDWEAIKQLNDFSFSLKKNIQAGKTVELKGVGRLQSGLSGEVKFEPEVREFIFDSPVMAGKILRDNAQHTMLVGEQERSSAEMTELLSGDKVKKDNWWIAAAILAFLAVLFIGWHFSEKGVGLSSVSNQQQTAPQISPSTYQLVPSK